MTTKKTTQERDNEKERGKKRYQERLIETEEAEREIDFYKKSADKFKEDHPNEDLPYPSKPS